MAPYQKNKGTNDQLHFRTDSARRSPLLRYLLRRVTALLSQDARARVSPRSRRTGSTLRFTAALLRQGKPGQEDEATLATSENVSTISSTGDRELMSRERNAGHGRSLVGSTARS